MEVGVRDLRNRTSHVIDAVRAGERVTLTVHGEPIADIVPQGIVDHFEVVQIKEQKPPPRPRKFCGSNCLGKPV